MEMGPPPMVYSNSLYKSIFRWFKSRFLHHNSAIWWKALAKERMVW